MNTEREQRAAVWQHMLEYARSLQPIKVQYLKEEEPEEPKQRGVYTRRGTAHRKYKTTRIG